jgi:uncharacterized protein
MSIGAGPVAARIGNRQNGAGSSRRGFASMDSSKQREISSKGGQSVRPEDRSFAKDRELAVKAGRKGGENSRRGRRPSATTSAEATRDRDPATEAGVERSPT